VNHTASPISKLFEYATLPTPQILSQFSSSPDGLSSVKVHQKLKAEGFNVLKHEPKNHIIFQFLCRFKDPLMLTLLLVAMVSFVMGEIVDGLIVIVMVMLSSILNFFQEYKASNAAAKLQQHLSSKAIVLRDGKLSEIPTANIVRGDILELNAGDLVPADSRILQSNNCFVNQSSLTGESMPAGKQFHTLTPDKSGLEIESLSNILFAGTSLITGTARAVVLATGSHTQFGSIADNLSEEDMDNEFTRGVKSFSLLIIRIIAIFVLIIFVINSLLRGDLWHSLAFAVAIAVGLTPEFLPMILSVSMGQGSVHMAKKGVIVKKLTAIPTFGSMDILCTDKTGTLTQDKIELVRCIDLDGNHSDQVLKYAYLNSYFQTGISNPLDEAIINYRKININGFKKAGEIPFDFERKKMSVVLKNKKSSFLITKGAPDEILKSCSHILKDGIPRVLTVAKRLKHLRLYEQLSQEGFRVLTVAIKELDINQREFSSLDEQNLQLLGFTAFLDPAKPEARAALDELEAMGIEVKIITGDNELVAKNVCSKVGVNIKGLLTGADAQKMSDAKLSEICEKVTIFARFSPDQKNRIIKTLRANGHVVGYMGDGINDAPSIKSADIGISVSNGVDVAKQSADIILTHKNLHQLKDGVTQGRKTYANTLKYIMMGLSSNFGNMFSVLGAVVFLPFLPMLPIQILLNNFLYDVSQLNIPSDSVDEEYIRTPKRWDMGFIRKFMLTMGPVSSFFDFITFTLLYLMFKNQPAAFQTGWFMQSLATQVFVIYVIRTKKIPFIQSLPSLTLLISTFITVFIGWIIPYLPVGSYFGLVPLSLKVYGVLLGIVVCYLVSAEVVKRWFYRRIFISNVS